MHFGSNAFIVAHAGLARPARFAVGPINSPVDALPRNCGGYRAWQAQERDQSARFRPTEVLA